MKNKKIIIFSVFAIVLVMMTVISFCVILPQKTPADESSTSAGVMIDKNPTDSENSDSEDNNSESNTSESLPKDESKEDVSLKDNENSNDDSETTDENVDVLIPEDSKENTNPFFQNLNFFVQEKEITKTKKIMGSVTTFEISFRIFVSNESIVAKTISSNAFSAEYATVDGVLYYATVSENNEKSIVLNSYESADFAFTVKYIIVDTEKFDLNTVNNLTISYMFNEILAINI